MVLRHVHQLPQSAGVEAIADSHANLRLEPELGFTPCRPDRHMERLMSAADTLQRGMITLNT